jgi:hypothetical protein
MAIVSLLRQILGWSNHRDLLHQARMQREHTEYVLGTVIARLNSEEQWFFNSSLRREDNDCACSNRPGE